MVLETLIELCVTEPDFLEKLFVPPKLGKIRLLIFTGVVL